MKITIIGAGAMGGATLEGLLKTKSVKPADITVADPYANLKKYEDWGVATGTDNAEAVKGADVLMLFVKPWLVENVLHEIKDAMDYDRQSIIVVAAGMESLSIGQWLEKDGCLPEIFLCIPNIGIARLCSMTFLVNVNASSDTEAGIKALFDEMGNTKLINESQLPAATALASCGIAYALRYVRAASEGGVQLGFKAKDAQEIVQQTMKGAVALLEGSGLHPEAAIDLVTTPGGITIKGLNAMEHAGFTSAVIQGLLTSK